MAQRWSEIRSLFEQALDVDASERQDWLRQRCGDDGGLLRAVQDLLRADSEPETALEDGPAPELLAASGQGMPGTRVGSFEIRRVLGAGGMGTVYEAVQDRPQRVVALKMLRFGLHTDKARRRFEYEAEILGRLRHPAIAQVVEAGTWEVQGQAQPYIAMEFVEGARSLDDFAREQDLELPKLLSLFQEICDAVHYAHQRGVIHRDLKPQNILIDQDGRPKVIDFGIARGTDEDTAQPTLLTEPGQLIGTLEYMSPEQLSGSAGDDIDTRVDVYALGVILFELLTGRLPFELRDKPLTAVGDIVRDTPPPRPSLLVFNRSDTAISRIPAELDWIVFKAMEKEPERRYASAFGLEADLGRFLAGEPVVAGPPSATYRLRKFVQRNRLVVGAAAVCLLALIGGTIATSIGWNRALRAEQLAESRRQQAEEVAHSFWRIDRLQKQVEDDESQGLDYELVALLDEAVERLNGGSIEDPSIQAAMRNTLAAAYRTFGKQEQARAQFEAALSLIAGEAEPLPEVVPQLMNGAGLMFAELGEYERAEKLLREGVEECTRLYGADSSDAARTRANLAHLLYERGRFDDAATEYEQAWRCSQVAEGKGHQQTIASLVGYGNSLSQLGRLDEAESALQQAVKDAAEHLGRQNVETLGAKGGLAILMQKQGRYAEAEALYLELVEIRTRISGAAHPRTLYLLNNLGVVYNMQQKYADAERAFARMIELRKEAGGGSMPFDLKLRYNLAVALHNQDDEEKLQQSEQVVRELLVDGLETLPAEHWMNAAFRCRLGICLRLQERFDEAEAELLPAIEALEKAVGPTHSQTQQGLKQLARLYDQWGKPEEAEKVRARIPAEKPDGAAAATADRENDRDG